MSRLKTLIHKGLPYNDFAPVYFSQDCTFLNWGLSVSAHQIDGVIIQYASFAHVKERIDSLCLD